MNSTALQVSAFLQEAFAGLPSLMALLCVLIFFFFKSSLEDMEGREKHPCEKENIDPLSCVGALTRDQAQVCALTGN